MELLSKLAIDGFDNLAHLINQSSYLRRDLLVLIALG